MSFALLKKAGILSALAARCRRTLRLRSIGGDKRNTPRQLEQLNDLKYESEDTENLCLEAMASTITKLDKIGVKFHVIIQTI